MPTTRLLVFLAALLLACTGAADGPPGNGGGGVRPPPESGAKLVRVLARLDATKEHERCLVEVESLAKQLGAVRVEPIKGTRLVVVELPAVGVDALRASEYVERVDADRPEGLF